MCFRTQLVVQKLISYGKRNPVNMAKKLPGFFRFGKTKNFFKNSSAKYPLWNITGVWKNRVFKLKTIKSSLLVHWNIKNEKSQIHSFSNCTINLAEWAWSRIVKNRGKGRDVAPFFALRIFKQKPSNRKNKV